MKTTWEQRRRVEQDIADGHALGVDDAAEILADADQAEVLEETLDALEQALDSIGYKLLDITSDDSEQTELHLVQIQ